MVIDLSVATEHFYIGFRSSVLFLVKQALLWPGASQVLLKCFVLGRHFLYHPEKIYPRENLRHLAYFSSPSSLLIPFLIYFSFLESCYATIAGIYVKGLLLNIFLCVHSG